MLPNIQLLRGIAAYLVIFVHLKELLPDNLFTNALQDRGYSGVDLFFVISGFIMVYSTANKPVSPSMFMLHRIRRISPLYYIFTLLVFALAYFHVNVFQNTLPDPVALLKSMMFVPFEKSPGRIYPLYFLGWTLNYEMFFYLLFASCMYISYHLRAGLCAAIILILVVLPAITMPGSIVGYFYTRPIMLDFVGGMLLASCRGHLVGAARQLRVLPWIALSIGIGVLLFAPSLFPNVPSLYAPPTNTVAKFGIPSTLIVMSAIMFGSVRTRGSPWQLLQDLGNASYSIYLSHFFVIGAMIYLANAFGLPWFGRFGIGIASIFLAGLIGLWLHRLVERPIGALFSEKKSVLDREKQRRLVARDAS